MYNASSSGSVDWWVRNIWWAFKQLRARRRNERKGKHG